MTHGILVIEDEVSLGRNIKTYLQRHGYAVEHRETAEAGLELFNNFAPDFTLLDLNLPGMNGFEALERLHQLDPDLKVVVITGDGSTQIAVDAMKAGAWDYVAKPVVLSDLKRLIEKAIGEEKLKGTLAYYSRREAEGAGLDQILGTSPAIQELKARIKRLLDAEHQAPDSAAAAVLITGETGTGKDLVARALHFSGPRRAGPYIELNCATLPPQLIEDELFGHERGAFTDAKERKLGLIEAADKGTLFLDEIGDIELAMQVKLLKLLENRMIRRLGAVREREVDVRFVTATNRPLETLVEEGRFRPDLYYRLRIVQLSTPPLKDRGDDIILLARHFLKRHAARYRRPDISFSRQAERFLLQHDWPGNVRELSNLVEQAVLLSAGNVVEPHDLAVSSLRSTGHDGPIADRSDFPLPENGVDLEQVEQSLVRQALMRTDGNITAAARLLSLSRDTLRYRIEKYGLKPADTDG